ncbi:virulence factor SrfC family protein [Dryocola sp. BD586]|uniref:virulence factor SrfC family protein n=1 Tax=Dryocola sp. BD586 TaxID=3133271 RepID=UPI003F507F4A
MNQSAKTLRALESWIKESSIHSRPLHNEADSLLGRVLHLRHRQQKIDQLALQPLTLGLYGHSVSGKFHLLKTLLAQGQEYAGIQLGDKIFNYFRHIVPENGTPSLAVRFTQTPAPEVENYPLLLNLHAEYELAIKLVQQYHARSEPRFLSESDIDARLAALQSSRQALPVPGMSREDFSAVADSYRQQARDEYYPDDGLLYQMAELAPQLSLNDRASLLALFWGEDLALTQSWLRQAGTLQLLGHARQVLAPASLVVDRFLQPAEGFLVPVSQETPAADVDTIVCTLRNGAALNYLNVAQQDLAEVCAEVVFTLSHPTELAQADVLDLPHRQYGLCADRLQPDILLLCNAVSDAEDAGLVATNLARWLEQSQADGEESLPRLVWTLTPFDPRFTRHASLDDGVQRLLTQMGHRWGTLQALEGHNMQRLREWLAGALNAAGRSRRRQALQQNLNREIHAGMTHLTSTASQEQSATEALIRALQSQAARQGELLDRFTLSREAIRQCWRRHQQHAQPLMQAGFNFDLFAEEAPRQDENLTGQSFARRLYQRWVNHLRQLGYRREVAERLGLTPPQLRALCDLLISTSYRLSLESVLEDALLLTENHPTLAITCAGNTLSDFISWLGYQQVAMEHRPPSRVNQGQKIFAPPPQASTTGRLLKLGERQAQGNATYLYDWLVALYSRAIEGTQQPQAYISEEQRAALLQKLAEQADRG